MTRDSFTGDLGSEMSWSRAGLGVLGREVVLVEEWCWSRGSLDRRLILLEGWSWSWSSLGLSSSQLRTIVKHTVNSQQLDGMTDFCNAGTDVVVGRRFIK